LICSSEGGVPHQNELSLKEWERIVEEAIDLGANNFFLSGGEPLSCSYFKEICQYIKNRGVSLSIYSSGNVSEGNELQPLKTEDLKPLSDLSSIKLVFSLEGARSETHDKMTCGAGSFENTIISIKKAIDLGLNVEVHFVPTKLNYKELPYIISLSNNLGVRKVSVLRFVAQGRGEKYRHLLEMNKEDLIQLKYIFLNIQEEWIDYVRIGSPFNPFLLSKQYFCTAGINRITIRYDGFAVPCEALKFLANNHSDEIDVRKNSLKKIWNNSKLFNSIKNIQNLTYNSECNSCSFIYKCRGGCLAQKILQHSIDSVDPYCIIKLFDTKELIVKSIN